MAEGAELLASARRLGRRLLVTEQFGYRCEEETLLELSAARSIGQGDRLAALCQISTPMAAQGAMRFDLAPWRKTADFPLGALSSTAAFTALPGCRGLWRAAVSLRQRLAVCGPTMARASLCGCVFQMPAGWWAC